MIIVKIILLFFTLVSLMIFASQNMHSASIDFVFGLPIDLPLIVIIVSSFFVGYVLALATFIVRLATKKRKKQTYMTFHQ
jgi:uncharacterized integral membrane protein